MTWCSRCLSSSLPSHRHPHSAPPSRPRHRPTQLLVALTASTDEEVQSIACYDIGEFVRHYPNGRAIARSLGAKDIVMKLVDHRSKEVQRHALTAVSKMMVQNWAVRMGSLRVDSCAIVAL